MIFTMLMFLALAIAIFGVLEAFNGRVVPLLDQVTQTTGKVRGTTEFVADEVVRPVIATAGSVARVRAMARAAVGKPSDGRAVLARSYPRRRSHRRRQRPRAHRARRPSAATRIPATPLPIDP